MTSSSSLFSIVLMILFSHIEFLRHLDLSRNRFIKVVLLLFHKFFSKLQLLLVCTINTASILCSIIRPLPVYLCWIMHHKEPLKKLSECYLLWVKNNSDSLCVTRVSFTNLSVFRVFCLPLLVSAVCSHYPWCLLEGVFDSPKATACKVTHRIAVWNFMISCNTIRKFSSLLGCEIKPSNGLRDR